MNILALFLRRPVFAIVINVILVVLGLISYGKLAVKQIPDIELPVVTINISYPGAQPEIIESQVSEIIEDSITGIDGVDTIQTSNYFEKSSIMVQFKLDADLDEAINSVRDKVFAVKKKLPEATLDPVISKININARPIIYLTIYSERADLAELSDIVEHSIRERFDNIDGVAQVDVLGDRKQEIRIIPNMEKMAIYKVRLQDIQNAVNKQNVETPLGVLRTKSKIFSLYAKTDLNSGEEVGNIILRKSGKTLLRLKDIADVKQRPMVKDSAVRVDGKTSIILAITKKALSNPINISDAVTAEIAELKKVLPPDIAIEVGYDQSKFIRASIKNVYETIFEAIILVTLIISLFIKTPIAVAIPAISIPLSLIINFSLMHLFGFSINIFTLLALVLAIGLVVDDAIVMMENIYRYIEEGVKPFEAALKGSQEVGFVIIVITIVLAAVFLPVGFLSNMVGKLFVEFAWTLAFTILVSGVVATTLTPVMTAKLLTNNTKTTALARYFDNYYQKLFHLYSESLRQVLHYRKLFLLIGLVTALGGIGLFIILPKELMPANDVGVIQLTIDVPNGASLSRVTESTDKLEEIFSGIKDIKHVISKIDANGGFMVLVAEEFKNRSRSIFDIYREILPKIHKISDIKTFAIVPPLIYMGGGGEEGNLEFYIKTNLDYNALFETAEKIVAAIEHDGGFHNVSHNLVLDIPRLDVEIDRDKAALYDLDINFILSSIQLLMMESSISTYKYRGNLYDINLSLERDQVTNPSLLQNLYLLNNKNLLVHSSSFINLKETVGPEKLDRYNKRRGVKVNASSEIYAMDEAANKIQKIFMQIADPNQYQIEYTGQLKDASDTHYSMMLTFVLALLFIYLILAAQFESFKDPFIILLAVPFSFTGAVLALKLTNHTINIYSQIGIITLIGLITKNSILIVEFLNQKLTKGMHLQQALLESAEQRFRPILMTSLAAIIGAVPMAFKTGEASENLNNIGWVIVGGLLVGTLFTIYIIPLICSYFKKSHLTTNIQA